MIYQQLIDNVLWVYVQPRDKSLDFASKVKVAEDETACKRATETTESNWFGTDGSAMPKLKAAYRTFR